MAEEFSPNTRCSLRRHCFDVREEVFLPDFRLFFLALLIINFHSEASRLALEVPMRQRSLGKRGPNASRLVSYCSAESVFPRQQSNAEVVPHFEKLVANRSTPANQRGRFVYSQIRTSRANWGFKSRCSNLQIAVLNNLKLRRTMSLRSRRYQARVGG